MQNIETAINTANQAYRRYAKGRKNKKTGKRGKVHKWGSKKKYAEMKALLRIAAEDRKKQKEIERQRRQ